MATSDDKFKNLGAIPVPDAAFNQLGATPISEEPTEEDKQFADLGAEEVSLADTILAKSPTKEVTPEDMKKISDFYGLTPEEAKELESVRAYFGGYRKDGDFNLEDFSKGFAGTLGRSILMNAPQYIYKKYQENPKYREALDTLSEVSEAKLSPITKGMELVLGLGGALKLGGAAAKVAKGSGTAAKAAKYYEPISAVAGGATQALTTSKEGEELPELVKGAALGGALYGGVYTAGKAIGKIYKGVTKVADDIVEQAVAKADKEAGKIEELLDKKVVETVDYPATKQVLIKNPEINSFQEFVEKVDKEDIQKLVPEDIIEKLTRDEDSLRAVNEALDRPIRGTIDPDKLYNRIAYDKYSKLKTATEDLIGKNRTIPELLSESPQFADTTIDRAFKLSKLDSVISELGGVKKLGPKFNVVEKAAIFISDAKPVAKIFDDKLGLQGSLSIERILDEGSQKLNLYSSLIQEPLEKVYKLASTLRKSDTNMDTLYKELDSGNIESAVGKEFKQFFSELKDIAQKADVSIKEIENYVPKMRKGFVDYRIAFNKETKDIANAINKSSLVDITDDEFRELLKNKRFTTIKNELEQLSGDTVKSADDFRFLLNQFDKRPAELRTALDTVATATKQRVGEIPDWALEKNVPNLAAKWIQNTFRYSQVRDTAQRLMAASTLADKAGQPYIAKYLRNLNADLLGKRRGTLNSFMRERKEQFKYLVRRKSEATDSQLLKEIYSGVEDLPDLLSTMQSQVYPNYLGYNPKSALQNLTSAYLQNMPELGNVLGTKLALESTLDIAAAKAKGIKLEELIINEGILPRQWTAEMIEALRDGIKSSPLRDASRKLLDMNTKAAMALFSKSEVLARAQTLFMAKRLGSYLAKNPQKAERIIARMSSGTYRKGVRDALKSGNIPLAQSELNKYMQSTNMFNYDRLNMSEYGRVMGPLFSIFSKWPTATAGKIAHYYISGDKKEASTRLLKVLLMPYLTLALADKLILPEPGESDIRDKLTGKKGLKGWTQIDSLPGDFSVKEGLLATPIVATGADFIEAISPEGKLSLEKWMNNTIRTFGPGAGTLRFLAEDLPLYIDGTKGEKLKFISED